MLRGIPWNWVVALWLKKTRMTGLPGEKSLMASFAISVQYTSVTDRRTPADS